MDGTIKGEPCGFEVGQVEGRSRACVMILEYRAANRDEVLGMARKALWTFRMKD
jgi:hypothetical protein